MRISRSYIRETERERRGDSRSLTRAAYRSTTSIGIKSRGAANVSLRIGVIKCPSITRSTCERSGEVERGGRRDFARRVLRRFGARPNSHSRKRIYFRKSKRRKISSSQKLLLNDHGRFGNLCGSS